MPGHPRLLDRKVRRGYPRQARARRTRAHLSGYKKGPGRNRGPVLIDTRKREAYLSLRCLSAVPRMSPSVAPESEEPYCAMASFSSATSSALIETCTLRAFLSNWIT